MSNWKKKQPQPIEVKGHPLVCPVCKNDHFWTRRVLLNTAVLTFFDLDWTNRRAQCFVCSECTYIYWFRG